MQAEQAQNTLDWDYHIEHARHNYDHFADKLQSADISDKLTIYKNAYPQGLEPKHQFDIMTVPGTIEKYIKASRRFNSEDQDAFLIWVSQKYPWNLRSRTTANAILDLIIRMLHDKTNIHSLIGKGGDSLLAAALKMNGLESVFTTLSQYLSADALKERLMVVEDRAGLTALHFLETRHDLNATLPLLGPSDYPALLQILNRANKIKLVWELITSIFPTQKTSDLLYHLLLMQDKGVTLTIHALTDFGFGVKGVLAHLSIAHLENYFFDFLPEHDQARFALYMGDEYISQCLSQRLSSTHENVDIKITGITLFSTAKAEVDPTAVFNKLELLLQQHGDVFAAEHPLRKALSDYLDQLATSMQALRQAKNVS